MAKWLDQVVDHLVEIMEDNPQLGRDIRLAIRRIERYPAQAGKYAKETRYNYEDPDARFRIGYNFHPDAEEIEVVVLRLMQ